MPLAPSAVRLLEFLPRDKDNPWVIAGRKPGSHLTDLQHPWRRIRARAGLDDVRIHDLRHSFASRSLALGEGLPMIGKLLGHAQVQTTARYAHLARDTVKASAARIGDSIDSDLGLWSSVAADLTTLAPLARVPRPGTVGVCIERLSAPARFGMTWSYNGDLNDRQDDTQFH